jgi:hypothetical protein
MKKKINKIRAYYDISFGLSLIKNKKNYKHILKQLKDGIYNMKHGGKIWMDIK